MKTIISITDAGLKFVYHDVLRGLLDHGEATITRASHVNPGDPALGQDPLNWYADLLPSRGPILGPFATRAQALEAEVAWINQYLLGVYAHSAGA